MTIVQQVYPVLGCGPLVGLGVRVARRAMVACVRRVLACASRLRASARGSGWTKRCGRPGFREGAWLDRRKRDAVPYHRCSSCGLTVHSAAAFSVARFCPSCLAALPSDARVYATRAPTPQIRCLLAARHAATAKARCAVRALRMARAIGETLELLVSELVANAVLHAGLSPNDCLSLRVTHRPDAVRLAVHDGGPGFVAPSAEGAGSLAPGGRGCAIVDALSDEWGIDCDASGCTVWCEVGVDEQPARLLTAS